MFSYKHYLSNVFQYVIVGSPHEISALVEILQTVNSSFARTVDNWDGTHNLWLSKTSFDHLGLAKSQYARVIMLNAAGIAELNGNGE